MKNVLALIFICFFPLSAALAESELSEGFKTRFGDGEVFQDKDANHHFVNYMGKEVLAYDGQSLELYDSYELGNVDVALFVGASGGIACPYALFILQTAEGKEPVVSKEFGSCLEIESVQEKGDSLVIEAPAYTPHPELLSKAEIKKREQTMEIFTWSKGKITESERKK